MKTNITALCLSLCIISACGQTPKQNITISSAPISDSLNVNKHKEELKKKLSPEEYSITCESATERAFTGKYWDNHEAGTYKCVVCGNMLFKSDTKYDSGSGWPSFYAPADSGSVKTKTDETLGMSRTEVICGKCGAHLGHLFDDGPNPTGLRYCTNSGALNFNRK